MKFGICAGPETAKRAREAGFDYIELPLNKIGTCAEEEYRFLAEEVSSAGIPVGAFSLLLPKTMRVIGPEYDEEELDRYLGVAFGRMAELGAAIVSFGSGKSRFVPDGMSYSEAYGDLVKVTKRIVKMASEYGITVAIEALNSGETNLINSLTEASALASVTGASLLVDAFHVRKENEDISHIALCAPFVHAHIATLEGRSYPTEGTDEVISFMNELKKTGYKGNISIEGKTENFEEEAPRALETLRKAWNG